MEGLGDYCQIISLPNPPIDNITSPEVGAKLTRLGNQTLAELVADHGDRFPAFVAGLPMRDVDAALAEIDYAINQLGARGVQIYTDVCGKPLDDPQFEPVFASMAEHDLPIWLHPARPAEVKDFGQEEKSRYEMWWALGWPYDTSVTMTRLAITGLYDRYPGLKIITHHCGGMIPFFEGRLDVGMESLGQRTSDEDYSEVLSSLKRPHGEYYKMFYADTAMFGATIGTKCGIEYFGADNVVFASDCPFASIPEAVGMMDHLGLNDVDKEKIFKGNAERLMNTSFG